MKGWIGGMLGILWTGTLQAMGMVVYDPINHIETALTAANAVQQTAQQVQAYLIQLQQFAAQMQNLQTLPQAVLAQVLLPYTRQMATAQSLAQTLAFTGQQITSLQQTLLDQSRQMSALQLTPQDYLAREIQWSQTQGTGLGVTLQGEVGVLQGLSGSYAQLQQLQGQIGTTGGMQQSFQTVNQHLNLLAGQNAQLMGLIASAQANASAQQQQDALVNGTAARTVQRRLQNDHLKIQQWHDQLQQKENGLGWGILTAPGP
ncbi:hypothetical protein [Ferrovum sp.]|uniref:hypothetical protein n=1 Tax=Ferrovum sp. TaxID=2609467 RepID=UPI0026307C13|nr:hypothetical protein [Ferrovum sp.]